MIDFFIKIVVPTLCLIVTAYLIPFLKEKKLYNYVVIAVSAAEQIFTESGMGRQKYEYVENWITNKFNIRKEDLKNIIESAVYHLNTQNMNKNTTIY